MEDLDSETLKIKGNECFANNEYQKAFDFYT